MRRLRAEGLTKSYGRQPVVRGVSLQVEVGRAIALVGGSGSGKSTVARMLMQLEPPDAGAVLLDDVPLKPMTRQGPHLDYLRTVQLVLQDPYASLNPVHTIRHHLARPLLRHGLVARGAPLQAELERLLQLVGLEPASRYLPLYPQELSGGQRQRVSIARALAMRPRFLIADEPTSMLDASLRVEVLAVLQRLVQSGELGLLLITHDLSTARLLCDDVVVLRGGEVVEAGPTETVLSRPQHLYTQQLVAAVPRVADFTSGGVSHVHTA